VELRQTDAHIYDLWIQMGSYRGGDLPVVAVEVIEVLQVPLEQHVHLHKNQGAHTP
jgi:hypothetical protein